MEAGSNTSTVALRVVETNEKGTQMSGGHKHRELVLQVWGLDSRLTTLFCKKIVTKFKEAKTGCNPAESSKESYGSKRAVLLLLMMMGNNYVSTGSISANFSRYEYNCNG
jgi:hypothetical protein